MRLASRAFAAAAFAMAASAAAAAGHDIRMAASFVDFPAGTACDVEDAFQPVRQIARPDGPRILMTGWPSVGKVYCDLADGSRVYVSINKQLRKGARTVGFVVYPSGRAQMTTSVVGGLITDELNGVFTASGDR